MDDGSLNLGQHCCDGRSVGRAEEVDATYSLEAPTQLREFVLDSGRDSISSRSNRCFLARLPGRGLARAVTRNANGSEKRSRVSEYGAIVFVPRGIEASPDVSVGQPISDQ